MPFNLQVRKPRPDELLMRRLGPRPSLRVLPRPLPAAGLPKSGYLQQYHGSLSLRAWKVTELGRAPGTQTALNNNFWEKMDKR